MTHGVIIFGVERGLVRIRLTNERTMIHMGVQEDNTRIYIEPVFSRKLVYLWHEKCLYVPGGTNSFLAQGYEGIVINKSASINRDLQDINHMFVRRSYDEL